MSQIREVDPSAAGWGRRRSGHGFIYLDESGRPITAEVDKQRCRELAIPPAWTDVWICHDPSGHIQATGVDQAGRRQYLYHPRWRAAQDALKYDRVLEVAAHLPRARRQVRADLDVGGMPRSRALAVAFTLLDRGLFRIGSESYTEDHGSFGLATVRKEHLRITRDGVAVFDYPAKSGLRYRVALRDEELLPPLTMLRRRRGGGPELLAYRERARWHDLTSDDITAYIKGVLGQDASAKDFRTWHGTVLAAVTLARGPREESEREQRQRIADAVSTVARQLGNTPAVSRSSYIDPRVIEAYRENATISVDPWPPVASGEEPGSGSGEEPGSGSGQESGTELPQPAAVEKKVRSLLTQVAE